MNDNDNAAVESPEIDKEALTREALRAFGEACETFGTISKKFGDLVVLLGIPVDLVAAVVASREMVGAPSELIMSQRDAERHGLIAPPAEGSSEDSGSTLDDMTIATAVCMVAEGNAKEVASNVLLACKRRGLIASSGRGRGVKYALTADGEAVRSVFGTAP